SRRSHLNLHGGFFYSFDNLAYLYQCFRNSPELIHHNNPPADKGEENYSSIHPNQRNHKTALFTRPRYSEAVTRGKVRLARTKEPNFRLVTWPRGAVPKGAGLPYSVERARRG